MGNFVTFMAKDDTNGSEVEDLFRNADLIKKQDIVFGCGCLVLYYLNISGSIY